jgi:hypothetical protein
MATALPAQSLPVPTSAALFAPAQDSVDRDARVLQRLVSATVVGAMGAVTLGAAIRHGIGYRCSRYCTDPDAPGFVETVLGVLAGGTIGSAIGASLPHGRGLCTGGQRLGRGLAGASLGLVAGIGFFMVPALEPAFMVTIPVGSVMFMRRC